MNSRMDGIQGAVLTVKLMHIFEWNEKRLKNALKYSELLSDCEHVSKPKIRDNVSHVFHIYCIKTKNRDALQSHLKQKGIANAIHYPTMLPFLKAYKYLGHTFDDFPVAFKCQDEILSLPMYPELTDEMITYIAHSIKEFYQ